MDLSIKRPAYNTENSDYRHKKFDHVRSSPLTLTQCEHERNMESPMSLTIESKFYLRTQAKVKKEYHSRDHEWELDMDEANIPSTPMKRRRVSKRRLHNSTNDVLPNAPKKRKIQESVQVTPLKSPLASASKAYASAQSTPILMPKISNEALARICQYNKNMVRKFPKKERNAKDQERRDKNTIACRMSRRLKKLENLATEEQYKIFVQEHLEQQKRSMQAAIYLNELIKCGAQISSYDELNNDQFMQAISKNLNLKYLQKELLLEPTISKDLSKDRLELKVEESEMAPHEIIDVESVEQQQKRPFTIAYLLGPQQ